MDGRRRGLADTANSRPVNLQLRTRPGALANIRLCANNGHERAQHEAVTRLFRLPRQPQIGAILRVRP
jgi:hypothetical protein